MNYACVQVHGDRLVANGLRATVREAGGRDVARRGRVRVSKSIGLGLTRRANLVNALKSGNLIAIASFTLLLERRVLTTVAWLWRHDGGAYIYWGCGLQNNDAIPFPFFSSWCMAFIIQHCQYVCRLSTHLSLFRLSFHQCDGTGGCSCHQENRRYRTRREEANADLVAQ